MQPEVIQSLNAALGAKDPLSATHCKNVAAMTARFGRILGLSQQSVLGLEYAAYIHDVGKIGIPEAVLNYPGRLGSAGFALIHAHPEIGAHIANCGALPESLVADILYHHERWDGQGYPVGLKGPGIPFGARILAVLDSIDAMCGQRYYRKAIFLQKCKDEISRCAGTNYDPEIIRRLLANWDAVIFDLYH